MSNSSKINHKNTYNILYAVIAITLLLSSCTGQITTDDLAAEVTPTVQITPAPTPTYTPTPEPDMRLEADFVSPRVIGSKRAFFSGSLANDKPIEDAGFLLQNINGENIVEIGGILFENTYYAQVNDLTDATEYIVKMYYVIDGKKEYTKNEMTFSTPQKVYTDDEVEKMIKSAMKGNNYETGSKKWIVSNTQRALALLNIPCGNLGISNYGLQVNQIKLEYSFNSFGRYTNWDMIDSIYDEDTVNTLKDIISVNENLEYADYFCPFTPTPHTLTSYNKYDEKGGQFYAEQYLYDNLKNDEVAYQSYVEYPWLYESKEFQDKYADIIKENEGNEEFSTDINHRIAENKFFFSYYNRAYIDTYAIPQDRTITLVYTGDMTVQTAAAFAYMSTEVPDGYPPLKISTSYRNYSTQAHFYTKGSGMEKALGFGDYWHLFRQSNSYVPGFSNHQYGIALDFQYIETFKSSSLYPYLQENAQRYGFYNYYREAWHWAYLGE